MHAGPEIGVAATKSFTSQITCLTLLALLLGRIRHLSSSQGIDAIQALESLPDKLRQVLAETEAIRELAVRESYPLEHCYAYSDSITDLPMLETVGHPTAVNPDRALRKECAARGWPVLTFSKPVSLRDRIPAPSTAAVATTAAVSVSALAAGALTYSVLRRWLL